MSNQTNMIIRKAIIQEDIILTNHFYKLWLDNNCREDFIANNWQDKMLSFIKDARNKLQFQAFIAELDSQVVASVCCQLWNGLYPVPFIPEYKKYGYIWNVYVESDYRRRGIGKEITTSAINYLKSIDCNKIFLHASPFGKPVYEKLGFSTSNEMYLDF